MQVYPDNPSLTLRWYQRNCVQAAHSSLARNSSTLFNKATGTGKTKVAGRVIKDRLNLGRALFLVRKIELAHQTKAAFERDYGMPCSVEQGNSKSYERGGYKCPVVVSMVQSQISGDENRRRLEKFDPREFSTIFVDEADEAVSDTYLYVLDWWRERNPEIKIAGGTATPYRRDGVSLRNVFDDCCFEYPITTAVKDGFLVNIKEHRPHVDGLDFSRVRMQNRELNQSDLDQVLVEERHIQSMLKSTIEISNLNRSDYSPTIAFCQSVRHAIESHKIYERYFPGTSAYVTASTTERNEIYEGFEQGKYKIIFNVKVLNRGWDCPHVGTVAMMTKFCSQSEFIQCVGRGTRPLDGLINQWTEREQADLRRAAIMGSRKPHLKLIDFAGEDGSHPIVSLKDALDGEMLPEDYVVTLGQSSAANEIKKETATRDDHLEARIDRRFEGRELFVASGITMDVDERFLVNTAEQKSKKIVQRKKTKEKVKHGDKITPSQLYALEKLGYKEGWIKHASRKIANGILAGLRQRDRLKQVSYGQEKLLKSAGIPTKKGGRFISKSEASALIDSMFQNKQRGVGFKPSPDIIASVHGESGLQDIRRKRLQEQAKTNKKA